MMEIELKISHENVRCERETWAVENIIRNPKAFYMLAWESASVRYTIMPLIGKSGLTNYRIKGKELKL